VARPLPFAGYSWQISQHEICFDEEPLVGLLATAALFEGWADRGSELNLMLAKSDIVTRNLREGKASPWRDYQQVLPEVGLMISTQTLPQITLTEIGRSFLAGSLEHADLMTLQMMRYQYPNGYKSQTLKAFVASGVSIRPGLMLLRGLIELYRNGIVSLSIDQIIVHFLPNRADAEWQISVEEILETAQSKTSFSRRRNIAAWARLLVKTTLFEPLDGELALSDLVISKLNFFASLSDHLISLDPWVPTPNVNNAMNWFAYFGSFKHVDPRLQEIVEVEVEVDEVSFIQDELELIKATGNLNLAMIDFSPIDLTLGSLPQATDDLFQSYIDGRAKLRFAKQEHDKIVNAVAECYIGQGWTVRHDPSSVDLLAVDQTGAARIIEVKTTTQKTMSKQVRTGVGQVLEYKYRYNRNNIPASRCDIVLNRPFAPDDWHREFCSENSITLDSFVEGSFMYGSI
jgi:hypothetical protein